MTLVLLLAILYLPGAIVFRFPAANRHTRAALPAEERVFWSVAISVIFSTAGALVLAAAGLYTLGRLAAANATLAAVLALIAGRRLRMADAKRPTLTALLPIALSTLGVWTYFAVPASEYILGGRDPGVYMNEGVQIAQRQSLVTVDPVAAAVPEASRDLFFPSYDHAEFYSVRYMGFHLRDPQAGTVSGQFPQGYPVWIAIAYGLDGVTGTRRVIAWWAIFGVVAVYFAARRLIGDIPAAAAAGLLCVHVIQTWYARYPNSEIVTQALLFAALLAHAYAHEDGDRLFGPIAASLLGLALFTRLPVVLVVGTAVAASLLAPAGGGRTSAGFLATLAAWIAAAGVYYTTQLRPYFNRPIEYVNSLEPIHLVPLALALAAIGALLWAVRRPRVAAATRVWLPRFLIVLVVGGAAYGVLFREPGGRLAPHDAHALRMFADLYFTRAALALAVTGYVLLVWRSFWRAPALILTVTCLALFFFYKMRIWPEHFWLARRFLTEILPGALIFAAGAMFAPVWLGRSRRVAGAIGVVAALVIGQHYLSAATPIRTHIEYAGIIPRLEKLAASFHDNDLVLIESRGASDVHTLGLPLSYVYARNVLVLADTRPDKRMVAGFLDWARERYENVYFMAGGGTDLLSADVGSLVVSTERFQIPEYEKTTYNIYPRRAVMKPFDFTIYELVWRGSTPAPQSLDIGATDDLHLVDFHPKERLGGGDLTFRWSQDASYLLMRIEPANRQVALRLSGGRPRGVPAPRVTVLVDGDPLGEVQPGNEFREYVFPIPEATAARAASRAGHSQIEIRSTTWIPQASLGGPDTRALGVMVDRAEIR